VALSGYSKQVKTRRAGGSRTIERGEGKISFQRVGFIEPISLSRMAKPADMWGLGLFCHKRKSKLERAKSVGRVKSPNGTLMFEWVHS